MINLKTITNIELSNVCNLSCSYCINRDIKNQHNRHIGIMSDNTFNATSILLETLVRKGTQCEVWLNGNGESLLDPQLIQRVIIIKRIMGDLQVGLSINGLLINDEIVNGLKNARIDRVDISPHIMDAAINAQSIFLKYGIKAGISVGILFQNHNWAGQLNRPRNNNLDNTLCLPLIEGRGYVQKEGNISPCCYDYKNLGIFGNVFEDNILEKPILPYELCDTCHQCIPGILKEYLERENND